MNIIIAIIICLSLVCLKLYTYRKAKYLRQTGYKLVYYYMKNCNKLEYYRNTGSHMSAMFPGSIESLKTNRKKWFLAVSSRSIIEKMVTFLEKAENFTNDIRPYYLLDHYFAYSESKDFIDRASSLELQMNAIVNYECQKFIFKTYNDREFYLDYPSKKYEHNIEELRNGHNEEFVGNELKVNKEYFDHILKYPLDQQQRESIVKLEDNCLVISSAGSGKTSTSIAKVKYLLDKRHLSKDEILVLSYNRKTAEEFQERLNIQGLTCKTFHAFACSIIGKVEGKYPDICDETFLLNCYYRLIKKNTAFKRAITEFVATISSLTKTEHEYQKAEDYYKDRETYGIMAPYGDMNGSPVFTRSEEERRICTWLSEHDVKFLYEQHYPIPTADTQHRQYKPDFTIYFMKGGMQYYLFLEHFGIDKNNNVPRWFGDGVQGGFYSANQKYNSDIQWKRQLHKKNNTLLLETTSAMFHDKTIYKQLEQQLRNAGVPLRELSIEEKYHLLFERDKTMEDNVMNLFTSFINLMKSNGKSFDYIMKSIKDSGREIVFCERCRFLMYEVIKPLYDEYEGALRENGQMDYTDTILHATELCNSEKWESNYSYILVDEFQDISVDRYKFIVSLRTPSPLTKTYCVGDDWQSIYRFSGSDMNLFNQFEKHFGYTERCKIETTYRFGNPLIEKSSKFILKNPSQVQKRVKPYSVKVRTDISFVPFSKNEKDSYLNVVAGVLKSIPANESVMLMGRYNREVNVFPKSCIECNTHSKRAKVTYAGRTMDFMSVHAAKGMEADHVLILNCSQDGGGFPSRISDDPILGYVLSEIDDFEYSEERRLFYVAITRAKKHTYVLYNEAIPSVFVNEMLDNEESGQMKCPHCKKGRLKMIKEDVSINGNRYRNYLCSNSVAGCNFFWQVYYDKENEIIRKYHHQMDPYFNDYRRQYIAPLPSGFPPPLYPPPQFNIPSGDSSSSNIPPPDDSLDYLPF